MPLSARRLVDHPVPGATVGHTTLMAEKLSSEEESQDTLALRLIRFESRTGGFVPENKRFEITVDETPAAPEASGYVTYEIAPDGDMTITFQDADS